MDVKTLQKKAQALLQKGNLKEAKSVLLSLAQIMDSEHPLTEREIQDIQSLTLIAQGMQFLAFSQQKEKIPTQNWLEKLNLVQNQKLDSALAS